MSIWNSWSEVDSALADPLLTFKCTSLLILLSGSVFAWRRFTHFDSAAGLFGGFLLALFGMSNGIVVYSLTGSAFASLASVACGASCGGTLAFLSSHNWKSLGNNAAMSAHEHRSPNLPVID